MFERMFIEELNKIFKSESGRLNIISLLIEAIRLELMEKRQNFVSFEEACEILKKESDVVINRYIENENTQIIKNILNTWGIC